MIIIGGDALALSTARELCLVPGHRIVVLWPEDVEFARAVAQVGALFVAGRPDSRDGLNAAGVAEAVTILALSRDDQLNLQAALRARDANPGIRIVLRQFNRTLAAKIEQNLANCSVLSLAWHSAATYAAAALDSSCFRGLQFPEPDGPLTGFALRLAEDERIAGHNIVRAEQALGARIVAINGATDLSVDAAIPANARLVCYGPLHRLIASASRRIAIQRHASIARQLREVLRPRNWRPRRIDPYMIGFVVAVIALFVAGTEYFQNSFHSDWLTAAYYVISTMTTTGLGDIAPDHSNSLDLWFSMALMLLGTIFTGLFIVFAAARLTRGQWVRMQGLRPIHRRGHIVVCGCGSIGTGVIDLLLAFDRPLVVVEQNPDAALVERARDRGFDLLTGDASRDDTLDLCHLAAAHSLLALTNVDTLNLEIALGARARNPSMPIVLRIAEAAFAESIARHFDFQTTFSVAALAGPVFAGLSRLPGARGRIAFDGEEFAIGEIERGAGIEEQFPPGTVVLAAAGDSGELQLARGFAGLDRGTRVLVMVPLAPYRDGSANFTAVAERVYGG
ncbi:MAG: NAD-binding protein [Alphaproteobacteria bacterium]|nr:NAD-binding protein [Alphaproteobacteria bacterium]